MSVFQPIMGSDSNILNHQYQDGNLYFATDSKKIYLDANGKNKIAMGGNSSVFYGIKNISDSMAESQKEFTFYALEIEGNREDNYFNIPNVNDLILNKDGCFYRVRSIKGEAANIEIFTEKLTIAGSGGGSDNSGGVASGDMKIDLLTEQNVITLRGYEYAIGFKVTSWNHLNEFTGNGTYRITVNAKEVEKGVAVQGKSTYIPIQDYLDQTENEVVIYATMDVGGAAPRTRSRTIQISVTEMKLIWDYDYTDNESIHYVDQPFESDYTIEGTDIEKTAWLQIDDLPPFIVGTTTSSSAQTLKLTTEQIQAYNLNHGSHIFKLWATTEVNGTNSTPPIYKNIAFIGYNEDGSVNTTPIINCGLFDTNLTQYDTIHIPINIYSATNINDNATIVLFEEGIEKDRWNDVPNFEEKKWSYTPTISGPRTLTVQCGTAEYNIVVNVQKLDLNKTEVSGYAFKFKASDFASNNAVQNWNSNGVNATFNNFDWINGGLKTETDESGNSRQYIAIKAGSTMDINYALWGKNASIDGKVLKIIFKATNCRDYDARILNCKKDKKVIKTDNSIEYLFYIENNETILCSNYLTLDQTNGQLNLQDPVNINFDLTNKDTREALNYKYALMEDGKIYQCIISETEESTENNKQYYAGWYLTESIESFDGIVLNAQNAQVNSALSSLDTQYCEDTYIELEMSVSKYDSTGIKNYIKFWIDGIPSGYTIYKKDNDYFNNPGDTIISIGSEDCDVHVYMIKLYERELDNEEHLTNFIIDAPNAAEMMKRHKRNDIINQDRKIIDPVLLSQANPDCLVHVYEIPRMTIKKKDPVVGCKYSQYHNSKVPVLRAENVMIKVQGTSSERYVDAAANLDTDFQYMDAADQYPPTGFIDTGTNTVLKDGWKMSQNAIPVNFTCTKVNVASCENANNALNQEWYNMFQPYKSVLRCKNPNARDTMQFTNGVMFMIDHQKKFDTGPNAETKNNNVFGELGEAYWNNPYPRMYSLAQMGNSKDNVHVFHDQDNEYECCVEVKDNQELQQKMISDNYNYDDIGADEKYFEFRYPEDSKDRNHINGWNRLVRWMAHSNPQPKYSQHTVENEKEFKIISTNLKNSQPIPVYVLNEEKTEYTRITEYNPAIKIYYTETVNMYGYTNLKLPEYELSYDLMVEDYKQYYRYANGVYNLVDLNTIASPVNEGLYEKVQTTFGGYTFNGYICEEQINPETKEPWQKNYTPVVKGMSTNEYKNTFTHDTYEYRMAKMLNECEHYLVMDSILYHYLFIERHSMIDNVAKNTFWSTEDCKHWNLIKDYDNDTSDGNDNNGKLTIPYGMEALDTIKGVTNVFNAYNSVWFNFIYGLHDICQKFYVEMSKKIVKYTTKDLTRELHLWDHNDYLWFFSQWQSIIPERCWVEDYQRKYFRPYEVYGLTMFNDMMQGGQKKHQRKQYETYQDIYISSKYMNDETNRLYFRPRGKGLMGLTIPVQTYSDCYVYMDIGSAHSHERVKRNTELRLPIPAENLENATMDLRPGNVFTIIGETNGPGQLNAISPDQIEINKGTKLRKIVFGSNEYPNAPEYNKATSLKSLTIDNPLLEELHIANIDSVECTLDLSKSPSLRYLDAEKSGFTGVVIADKAPITDIYLNRPSSLTMSNLTELEVFDIAQSTNIQSVRFDNIDNKTISSKDIIQNIIDSDIDPNSAFRYTLKNINWVIDSPDEIVNNEILVLKYLLTAPNRPNQNANTQKDEPTTTSLTGVITITANAYNGNNAIDIYNKYVNETTYPQLDLKFEGDKAKLYNVNLYDGNEKIYWAKKIVPGAVLSNEFLSSGPYGAFNLAGIYKSDTSDYNYTFTGNWKVYTNEDFSDESPLLISNLFDLGAINNDVYLVPQFTEQIRTYRLEFYGEDHETPLFVHESIPAGTLYKDIPQLDMPVKILPEGTPLKAGYDFIGYALIADSLTPVSGEYKVRNDQKFYAIFEQITDMTERVHPEWFNYDNGRITPKVRLKGKITIPSTYTDKDGKIVNITRLGEFNTKGCQITHVFCAPNSKLTTIDREAFYSSVYLEYFDFSQNTVTNIGQWAFRNCMKLRPDLLQLSNKLISVGEYAFTGAFEALSNVTLVIPASVQTIGNRGFGNLNIGENSTIQVGEIDAEGNIIYSNLNLANGTSSATELEKFSQNTKNIATFKFYSKLYDSFESPIKTFGQVYNAFIRDFSGTMLNAIVSKAINSSAEFTTLMSEHGELYQIKNEDDNNYNLIFELATQYPDDGMPHYYYYNRDFDYYDNITTDEAFAAIAASGKELFIIDSYNRFASDGGQIVGDRRIRFAEVPKENGIYVRQPNKTVYYFDKDPSLQDDFAMAGYTLEFYKEGN